jgi:hypothetical protein
VDPLKSLPGFPSRIPRPLISGAGISGKGEEQPRFPNFPVSGFSGQTETRPRAKAFPFFPNPLIGRGNFGNSDRDQTEATKPLHYLEPEK